MTHLNDTKDVKGEVTKIKDLELNYKYKNMKIKLIIFLALLSLNSMAQNTNEESSYFYYCQMRYDGKYFGSSGKGLLLMNDKEELTICDDYNKPIQFAWTIQIVNFMSEKGWEYVSRDYINGSWHYILRKKVTKDEDAKAGLNLLTSDEVKKAKK